jgi:hypothetical protein
MAAFLIHTLVPQVVSKSRAEEYAASINGLILETSAKDNWGVSELFHRVAERVIEARGPELFQASEEKGMRISVVDAGGSAPRGHQGGEQTHEEKGNDII